MARLGLCSPAERVRSSLVKTLGAERARRLPDGYHRLGDVLVLRLPGEFRPEFREIGAAWQHALGVATVLAQVGPVDGELRSPQLERIAGTDTETEVVEHGIRFRLDAARLMFATGNRAERHRAYLETRPGESVVDLFAGIGYFAIPAARAGARNVVAVEKNPLAHRYLEINARANGVPERILALLGDNRTATVPEASADRIFLGYLPSAVPWIPRALGLARPCGAVLHVHAVGDVRGGGPSLEAAVRGEVEAAGGTLLEPPIARRVKPYGPGREHLVADLRAAPA